MKILTVLIWILFITSNLLIAEMFFMWKYFGKKQHWTKTAVLLNENFEINNNGPNVNLLVNKSRYTNIPENKLKTILFFTSRDMEEAFGFQKYDFGEGHQIFKTNLCPDPRCIATANRSYLKSVEDFDAVIIHQRAYNVCMYIWYPKPKYENGY